MFSPIPYNLQPPCSYRGSLIEVALTKYILSLTEFFLAVTEKQKDHWPFPKWNTKPSRSSSESLTLKPSQVYLTFFFQTNTIRVILINTLKPPSFIMAVTGHTSLKLKNVHPSIIYCKTSTRLWGVNEGLLKRSNAFV